VGNRFDDPMGVYRVLYASSQRLGCFIETLARLRKDVSFVADLALIWNGEDDFKAFLRICSAGGAVKGIGILLPAAMDTALVIATPGALKLARLAQEFVGCAVAPEANARGTRIADCRNFVFIGASLSLLFREGQPGVGEGEPH
jgi:hypothetical protein